MRQNRRKSGADKEKKLADGEAGDEQQEAETDGRLVLAVRLHNLGAWPVCPVVSHRTLNARRTDALYQHRFPNALLTNAAR